MDSEEMYWQEVMRRHESGSKQRAEEEWRRARALYVAIGAAARDARERAWAWEEKTKEAKAEAWRLEREAEALQVKETDAWLAARALGVNTCARCGKPGAEACSWCGKVDRVA